MKRSVLFDAGEGGGGGGTDWKAKFDGLRTEYDNLKKDHADLKTSHEKLTKDHETLSKEHETTSTELGTYKGAEARKGRLETILQSAKYKGKVTVDEAKAMRYLEKGGYDPATLDADIHEAIELFGSAVEAKANPANPRGAGSEAADRKTGSTDPMGDVVASVFGGR